MSCAVRRPVSSIGLFWSASGSFRRVTASRGNAGPLVRQRRQAAHLSQLDLALEAGVSPRHLSFVELGKSRPSGAATPLAVVQATLTAVYDRPGITRWHPRGLGPMIPRCPRRLHS
jgi:DNA-binding XRE family transcriptional regulator